MANTVRNYGIGGGVSIAIGLIGAGIQSRWPDKNVGTGLMIVGGLAFLITIVAAIARWHTIREYERKHAQASTASSPPTQQLTQTATANPHNEFKPQNVFKPTVEVHVPVNQNQKQTQREAQLRPVPSVFEATDNTRIELYGFNTQTGEIIREPYYYGREEDLPDHITIVNTALAQFHYRHDANVEPSLHVSAQIFAHDSDRQPLKPSLYHTIWDNKDLDRVVTFSAGQVRDLIVAMFRRKEPEGIVLIEHTTNTWQHDFGEQTDVVPKIHELKGDDFFIRIELAPKRWNDPLPKQVFWFRLSLTPKPEFVSIKPPAPAGVRFPKPPSLS